MVEFWVREWKSQKQREDCRGDVSMKGYHGSSKQSYSILNGKVFRISVTFLFLLEVFYGSNLCDRHSQQ